MAARRLSEMSIDLGDEQIVLERIESMESLSAHFSILVDVISPLELDLQPHLGKPCSLKVFEDDELLRHFHGLVIGGEYVQESPAGHHYRLALKPWTWFLSQNRQMAIFQDLSAVDIIKQVFSSAGAADYELRLSHRYDARIYCVQYQESDFAFVSRLMEEEGIYYFFRHEPGAHVMVICDAPGAHQPGKPDRLVFNPNSVSVFAADSVARSSGGKYYLHSWIERVSTGAETRVAVRDFDFTSPDQPLSAEHAVEGVHARDDREVFCYPGNYAHEKIGRGTQQEFGRARSKVMIESRRALRRVFTGTSQAAGIGCGSLVSVSNHPVGRMNSSYLVISTYHNIASETYRSGQVGGEALFNVRFEAIPAETPYRPPHVTPRPLVQGLESAIVTGPAGEEIYTDEYGRVKVQFHWDREGRHDEKTTCWIRVSQTGGLGNIILPRVGHEVLVDFLMGDPDRPIVVGRVFNQANMPIYELPDNKTRALWRTKRYGQPGSYPETRRLDTGAPGANELRFEDKGGKEEIFLHAERDMNTRIRFDETHHVGHDQEHIVGRNRSREVGKKEAVKIGTSQTLTVGTEQKTKVGTSDTLDVGTDLRITAGKSVEITVGASKIKMDPTSITISSPTIKIEGKASVDVKSALTKVSASGVLTLKGSLTTIN